MTPNMDCSNGTYHRNKKQQQGLASRGEASPFSNCSVFLSARGLFHLQKAPSFHFAAIHPKKALHRRKRSALISR